LGRVLEGVHASFVEVVPFKQIAIFTIFQFVYFFICFGVAWIPIAGILFPLPFFLLIGIRQRILPKLFQPNHLQELDADEYEEIAGAPARSRSLSLMVHSSNFLYIWFIRFVPNILLISLVSRKMMNILF
jgi:hypothetical protein